MINIWSFSFQTCSKYSSFTCIFKYFSSSITILHDCNQFKDAKKSSFALEQKQITRGCKSFTQICTIVFNVLGTNNVKSSKIK